MGGFFKPNTYVKRNWEKSLYRPKRMAKYTTDITQEINMTCNNLRELSNCIYNISRLLNSSSYSSYARNQINQINNMNSNLSRTTSDATHNLINTCNIIASRNQKLANSMKEINKQMLDDTQIIERYFNDGR